MALFVDYSQTLECYKSRICYEKMTEIWICDIYEYDKLCIVIKMVQVLLKNERPPTILIVLIVVYLNYEDEKYNICWCRHG